MPHILLLRLAAPMQSWGVSSRFSIRDTGKEPSKSGVIGLLCAALGISREEANANNPQFADLLKLEMGVRVNREGILQTDYHTAQNIAKADGGNKETELSTRYYLSDADFLVGLAGDNLEFLEMLQNALRRPKWQIFLGRKAFVPSLPVYYTSGVISNQDLATVLKSFDLNSIASAQIHARLILENEAGSETRPDVPLSFAARRFTNRRVTTTFFNPKGDDNSNGNTDLSFPFDFEPA